MVVVARTAPHLPCCVWLAVFGHGLCVCVGTGLLIVCSSGNSSGTRKGALVCAQWRGALACMYMRKSFYRLHMWGHLPQSSP